jgi:2-polyprenyl-3-methyl-5-hydroxy-6-metoxy-1,4-benzoquinol methylase
MENTLVRLIGWRATILHGDPCVFDRWLWLKKHLTPGNFRTLDAGCGSGAFTFAAVQLGNNALGLDFNKEQIKKAKARAKILNMPRAEFIQADLRELDKLGRRLGKFDQIICFETIEHILDDKKLIKNLAALLKPKGRLLLTTPFKHSRLLFGDDKISEQEDGGHVRRGYTHNELKQLFNEANLEIKAQDYLNGIISQQLTSLMRRLGVIYPKLGWALIFPFRALQIFDRPLTRIFNYPYLSIGVVGVKRQ